MKFFLFPGQGSQVPGMGRDFYDASPPAREVFDRASALATPGFLDTVFSGSGETLRDTRVVQPALLTVEVAIARHLEAAGHMPAGCAGHSLGELVALVVAGAASFDAIFRLTQVRARLTSENVPQGGMTAVLGLTPEEIAAALPTGVEIANFNGPAQTIISGAEDALVEAERALKAGGAKRVIRLQVSGPFHSSYMRSVLPEYQAELDKVAFTAPRVRFVSSVSGDDVDDPEAIRKLLDDQLCRPVRWTDVMRRVGPVPALEVGPGRVLQGLAKRMEGAPIVEPVGTIEAAWNLEVAP